MTVEPNLCGPMTQEAETNEATEPDMRESAADSEENPKQDQESVLGSVIGWIENNPSLALVGAFAVGVFIGVLVRD